MSENLGNKEIISKNIKRLMELNDIDRKTLSENIGVKYSTLSEWINGRSYPRIDKIEKLASFFKVSKSDLIEPYKSSPREILAKSLIDKTISGALNWSINDFGKVTLDKEYYLYKNYEAVSSSSGDKIQAKFKQTQSIYDPGGEMREALKIELSLSYSTSENNSNTANYTEFYFPEDITDSAYSNTSSSIMFFQLSNTILNRDECIRQIDEEKQVSEILDFLNDL